MSCRACSAASTRSRWEAKTTDGHRRTSRCSLATRGSRPTNSDGRYALRTDDGDEFTADQVVIAAGSRAVVPEAVTACGVPYHTSDTIMRIPDVPERLIIVGGGFIACEFAHIFSALGSHVTLMIRGSTLLRGHDDDISMRFTDIASKKWEIRNHHELADARQVGDCVEITCQDGSTVRGDALLVATGRVPNGDLLDAENAGVKVNANGQVVVDEFQRTTARGIFALGDVSSDFQLKHVANHEARVVKHNLLQDWDDTDALMPSDHRHVPSAVFTDPQIASVGLTENEARAKRLNIKVKVQDFGDVAYGWAMEDTTGIAKIIVDDDSGLILGAHIMGHQASSLIQPLIQAMSFDLPAQDMARGQYWIHPALPEVIENALLGVVRRAALAAVQTALTGWDQTLLALPEAPNRYGNQPCRNEQPDDHEADELEVRRPDRSQWPRLDTEAVDQQAGEHDDADDQSDDHRQHRDGQVVVDLADRLQERPAVGPRHEDAVECVEQAHPRGEEHRQHQNRVPGQSEGGGPGGQYQQRHLGGGVEAQAHEQAYGVEVPGLADPAHDPGEKPRQKTALLQVAFEFGLVEITGAHLAENLGDADRGEQVRQPDQNQERTCNERAHQAERLQQWRALVLHRSDDSAHADGQQKRQPEHHAGMAKREPETGGKRTECPPRPACGWCCRSRRCGRRRRRAALRAGRRSRRARRRRRPPIRA